MKLYNIDVVQTDGRWGVYHLGKLIDQCKEGDAHEMLLRLIDKNVVHLSTFRYIENITLPDKFSELNIDT